MVWFGHGGFRATGCLRIGFYSSATLFVPNVKDESVAENAAKYFEIIKNRQYTCSSYDNCANVDISETFNNCTDLLSIDRSLKNKAHKRKLEKHGYSVHGERP